MLLHDGHILPFVALVLEALERRTESNLVTIRVLGLGAYWREYILQQYLPGCIGLHFDEFLVSASDIEDCLVLISAGKATLQAMGPKLDGPRITKLVGGDDFIWTDPPIDDYMEAFDRIEELIKKHSQTG